MEKTKKQSATLRSLPSALRSDKIILSLILSLGFLGFLNATYLTMLHLSNAIPPCSVTHGCSEVLTSQFASVGPIPISGLGMGYFVTVMILAILFLQKHYAVFLKLLLGLTTLGFLTGLGLLYNQAAVLHAFCQFCLLTELTLTLMFLLTGYSFLMKNSVKMNRI